MTASSRARSVILLLGLMLSASLALLPTAAGEHPAERVTLVIIDGPRHDLAHDPGGPLAPLYELEEAAVAVNAWTAGRPKTLPGHAALLTGQRNDISNLGFEAPHGQLIWQALNRTHGWGPAEMAFVHHNPKLDLFVPEGMVEAVELPVGTPDPGVLDALAATWAEPERRLVVVNLLRPDSTGHDGDWPAHEASLAYIGARLAPMVEAEVARGGLVIVTADHGRACDDPTGHGGWGPWPSADACDAHVPLLAFGWHARAGARVGDCITHADVTALMAYAQGTWVNGTTGTVPFPLLDEPGPFEADGCPATVDRFPRTPPLIALGLTVGTSAGLRRRHR